MGIEAIVLSQVGIFQILVAEGVTHIGIIIACLPGLIPEGFLVEAQQQAFRMMRYQVTDVRVVLPDTSVKVIGLKGIRITFLCR